MASFNQSPLGQTASSAGILPSITLSNSSTAIIPTLSVTIYLFTGGMTAGGATAPIGGAGGGGGSSSLKLAQPLLLGKAADVSSSSAKGLFNLSDQVTAKREGQWP
jgi:hypothetical protein